MENQARTEYLSASKSSLSASTSTASCSSPKVLTQFSALHDAVRTYNRELVVTALSCEPYLRSAMMRS